MAKKKEEEPKKLVDLKENAKETPKKQVEPSELEARVVALEEKMAKYASLDRRISENGVAISKVRNCIGAVHK